MAAKIIWEWADEEAHPAVGTKYLWRIVDTGTQQSPWTGTCVLEFSPFGERGLDAMGQRFWVKETATPSVELLVEHLAGAIEAREVIGLTLHAVMEMLRFKIPFDRTSVRFERSPGHEDMCALVWNHNNKRFFVADMPAPWSVLPTAEQVTEALKNLVAAQL